MKHKILSIICCAFMVVGISGPVLGVEFVHPGISHNQAELAFVKSKFKAQEQPWKEAWERMMSSKEATLSWQTQAVAHVERGAYNRPDIGGSFFMRGGKAAYTHALLWVLTDKEAHAQKAAEILNAWSATLESVTNHDAKLLVGMGGLQFCNAAELLKHTWSGWPAKDQQAFRGMLQKVFYPVIQDFFPRANGNWDASMIQTMMAMGIFLDDHAMFQRAVDYYLKGAGNGAVSHYFKESGQCQESGRDQGHTQMGLEYLVNSAEIAWKQGVDLYSAYDNRLAKGFEYTAKYNLGHDVPFETYESYQGKYKHTKISAKSRGRLRPMYEKIVNHYHKRMGMDMPWCQKAIQKTRPEAGGTMPWSTLMYAGQPAGLVKLTARGKEPPEDTAFVDRILPAPKGGGYEDPDYWVWGSSVIKGEDGKYHMFASRWLKKLGFGKWVTNSEVVHAVADTPVGPYKTVEVALPVRGKEHWDGLCTHNPKVVKYKNKYLLYYFGNTYDFRQPTVENTDLDSEDRTRAWMNKRVGVAISESVYGPWKRLDKPVIEPREGHWDASKDRLEEVKS